MPAAGWGHLKRDMKRIIDNYVESFALGPLIILEKDET